ncbi:MAG: DUF308 domain-containing protein [Bacteroidota bacterium]
MEITVDRSIRHWWVFILRGLLFIGVSIYLFASPLSGLVALSFMFGLVILLTGITELLRAYRDHGAGNRGWHLFIGLVDLLLGLVLMSHLAAGLLIMRVVIGFYFLFKGITVLTFRKHPGGTWWVIIGSLLVFLFVVLIWFNPTFGAAAIVVWTGMAFLITGVLNVSLGLRMRPRG